MKILVEHRENVDSYVITFTYAGIHYYAPLEKNGDFTLTAELLEKPIADLMNLCIQELQDIKRQKVIKEEADRDRVKFIGVD